jgi:hypothetical protein
MLQADKAKALPLKQMLDGARPKRKKIISNLEVLQ